MKIPTTWLKDIVDLKVPVEEVERLLPLRTIGTKEITNDFIELDMKGYNRPDLLSIRGVAYEVGAITDSPVLFTETKENEYIWAGKNLPQVEVIVENPEIVPVYCIAKIEGLEIKQSEEIWIKKLENSGMRSVNNIVDVTNLVMLEYGQPLHAFNAQNVDQEKIIVRLANEGEKLVTLDNKERSLASSDLVIADPDKALGLAGVMGGKNSEVEESPTTILLEAAIFDPVTIRKTAQRLNLPSEASKRFQHGLTKKGLLQALSAAIKMYQDLGGKLTAISLVGDFEEKQPPILLRQDKVNSLIGLNIPVEFIEKSLKKLHFQLEKVNGGWKVTPPYFRLDIEIEADIIEEVARMYGYEKIPAQELQGELPEPVDQIFFNNISSIRTKLVELGLTEVQTYSYFPTSILDALQINKDRLIRVTNPMSTETEYLKDKLWPNLLKATADNLKQRCDLAIFEIGKIYIPQEGKLPEEKYMLSITLSNTTDNPIQELYSIFREIASKIADIEIENTGNSSSNLFHPTRYLRLKRNGQVMGELAEVHPKILDKLGANKRVAVLELEIKD